MTRRILIGGGYPHHLSEGVAESFRKLGWETELFDMSAPSFWEPILVKPLNKLVHNLRIRRHPELLKNTALSHEGRRSRLWLKTVSSGRFDAAVLIRGSAVAAPVIGRAAAIVPHYMWFIEHGRRVERIVDEARSFQKIYAIAVLNVSDLRKAGIAAAHLPHRVPDIAMRFQEGRAVAPAAERRYDWCFVGAWSPEREALFTAVIGRYPNGVMAGPNWRRARNNPIIRKCFIGDFYERDKVYSLYASSKVGMDIYSQPETPPYCGMSMRLLEMLSQGCVMIAKRNPEYAAALTPAVREELFEYESEQELISQVGRALDRARSTDPATRTEKCRPYAGYDAFAKEITLMIKPNVR
ncbi:hypothetical protein HY522_11705 [bacterium]|nr:hypothetical protein [bacterium]